MNTIVSVELNGDELRMKTGGDPNLQREILRELIIEYPILYKLFLEALLDAKMIRPDIYEYSNLLTQLNLN